MRNFKKLLAVSLIFVFLFSLVGCSGSQTETKEEKKEETKKSLAGTTIKVLAPANPQYVAMEAKTKKFEDETGIKVEYVYTPYASVLEKITTEGVAGQGFFDVVNYQDAWGQSIKQFLEPLDEMIQKDGYDMSKFPDAYQVGNTYDGKVYGVPLRGHPQMLFYRKDIFDKLGLKPPTTWAEVEATAKTITEKTDLSGISMYYGKGNGGQNLFLWVDYLWTHGGEIFDKDWKPVFNDQKGVEATERFVKLLLKDKTAAPGSISANEQDAVNSIAQGKSAMWMGWWWSYANMNNPEIAAKEVIGNIGFAPMPSWEGEQTATYAISLGAGIMKASKNKEAAWEYIKYISSPEVEKQIVVDTYNGTAPAEQKNIVVVQKANLTDADINKLSGGLHETAAKNVEKAKILPQTPQWPEVQEIISTSISEIAAGKPTKQSLDNAAKAIEEVMKKAGYYN